jgi:hypothetical protein
VNGRAQIRALNFADDVEINKTNSIVPFSP